jgi:hypothetical protein
MAERHVADGEIHLSRQKALIAELDGHDTADAPAILATMLETQRLQWRTETAS